MSNFFNSPILTLLQSGPKTPEQQVQFATSPLQQSLNGGQRVSLPDFTQQPIQIKSIIPARDATGTAQSVRHNTHTDQIPINVNERFKQNRQILGDVVETAIDFTPVIGDIKGLTWDPIKAGIEGGFGAGLSMAGLGLIGLVPGWGDAIKKVGQQSLLKRYINKAFKTPEFNYKVREHIRNEQLYKLMDYGPNSNILVHGDPAATGISKVGDAIAHHDGKLTSFPHFENNNFVPRQGNSYTFKQGDFIRSTSEDGNTIFWGDGVPFFETRTGNIGQFDNDELIKYLATGRNKYAKDNPNDFVLEHPYRYIATKRKDTKDVITTRSHNSRDAVEIQSKEVPIDKIWGIEWDPLTQTWGKTIYSTKGTFHKLGGKINEDNTDRN